MKIMKSQKGRKKGGEKRVFKTKKEEALQPRKKRKTETENKNNSDEDCEKGRMQKTRA